MATFLSKFVFIISEPIHWRHVMLVILAFPIHTQYLVFYSVDEQKPSLKNNEIKQSFQVKKALHIDIS